MGLVEDLPVITPETVRALAERDRGYACQHCEVPFDPIAHRWLCPHCKTKNTCCE